MELILLEAFVLIWAFIPFAGGLYAGKCLAVFRSHRFEFRPVLYSNIVFQVVLLINDIIIRHGRTGEHKVSPAMLVVLGLQIAVLLYETIINRSGVHERGITWNGFLIEWSSIAGCNKEESEDWSTYIVIKYTNGKLRRIVVDGAKADEICEIIKSWITKRKEGGKHRKDGKCSAT